MGFVEMGIVVEHVTTLKPGPKFTLAMLADRADKKDRSDGKAECWPSIRELVRRTAQSRSTVLRQLSFLHEIGIIDIEKRWCIDEGGQARQATNKYIIDLPGIMQGRFQDEDIHRVIHRPKERENHDDASMGVKMTPKPKTAGHAKGVKMTPIDEYGCQKPPSMGVTGDTPRKININTNPSPSIPLDIDEPGVATGQGPDGADAPGAGCNPRDEFSSSPQGDHLGVINPDSTLGSGHGDAVPEPAGHLPKPAAAGPSRKGSKSPAGEGEATAHEAVEPESGASSRTDQAESRGADRAKTREKAPLADENPSSGTDDHLRGLDAGKRPSGEVVEHLEEPDSPSVVPVDDWEVIQGGLPEAMQDLPPREVPAIAEMIRQRIRGGWTLTGLRNTLGARGLPSEVRYLPGLVKARLRDDVPPYAAPPKKPASSAGTNAKVFRAPKTPRPDELLSPKQRMEAQKRRRALIDQALSKKPSSLAKTEKKTGA